jgi:SP family general alpha glucoside:H+ symporter-like MFS transporter
MLQVLVGYVVTSYFTYFYEQAGLLADQAFDMSVSQCCISWMCACVAFYLNGKLHRRTILTPGLTILTLIMLTIGFISIPHPEFWMGRVGIVFVMVVVISTDSRSSHIYYNRRNCIC